MRPCEELTKMYLEDSLYMVRGYLSQPIPPREPIDWVARYSELNKRLRKIERERNTIVGV